MANVKMVSQDKRRPLSLKNNPITDIFNVIFGEEGLRGSTQRLAYDALEVDRMTGESYDEFMYPDFKSIDHEIDFLEQQNKILNASLVGSVAGLDFAGDIAGAFNALRQGQPGHAAENIMDLLMVGGLGGMSGKTKLLRNQERLSELKKTKKTHTIVNKYKKPLRNQIKQTIERDLKKGMRGAKPSKRELRKVVESITNSTMSSRKMQDFLKQQGYMKFDDVKKMLGTTRHGRRMVRKGEIKLGKQNTLTKDTRKLVDKFLKNNVPFYQKGVDNFKYYTDVLKSNKYAKNFGDAVKYAGPFRNILFWGAGMYGASSAYMGFKYGSEGIYDTTSSGKTWDIAGLPMLATYDLMQSTVGGKEGAEGALNPTTVRKYFNEKKLNSYLENARKNKIIENKQIINNFSKNTQAETTRNDAARVDTDFDTNEFNERVILDNPSFSSRKIDSLTNVYDKYEKEENWDKADYLINQYPFLGDYSREKPY